MHQPEKNKPRQERHRHIINLNDGAVFKHYSGLHHLVFEYGLAQLSSSPSTVMIAVTLEPMTRSSTSYSVNLTASNFIDSFEKASTYQATDIFKIFIIGIDEDIKNLVADFKDLGINPKSIYTYDIDRISKGYFSTWEFDPSKGYVQIPGIHN
jgi:hypothetical protein